MPLNSITIWIPVGIAIFTLTFTISLGVVYQTHHFDKRFDQICRVFDQIDKRFDQIDKRFDQIDKRFDALEKRLSDKIDAVEKRLSDRIERLEHPIYRP